MCKSSASTWVRAAHLWAWVSLPPLPAECGSPLRPPVTGDKCSAGHWAPKPHLAPVHLPLPLPQAEPSATLLPLSPLISTWLSKPQAPGHLPGAPSSQSRATAVLCPPSRGRRLSLALFAARSSLSRSEVALQVLCCPARSSVPQAYPSAQHRAGDKEMLVAQEAGGLGSPGLHPAPWGPSSPRL